jgi:hypothetical protein
MRPRHPIHTAFLATSLTALTAIAACSPAPDSGLHVVPPLPSAYPSTPASDTADPGLGLKAETKAKQ